MKPLLTIGLLLALASCGDSREEQRRKQQEILRQQSSKWADEQKNYRLPELGKKDAQNKPEEKGTKK